MTCRGRRHNVPSGCRVTCVDHLGRSGVRRRALGRASGAEAERKRRPAARYARSLVYLHGSDARQHEIADRLSKLARAELKRSAISISGKPAGTRRARKPKQAS